jgi:hypothetical protein
MNIYSILKETPFVDTGEKPAFHVSTIGEAIEFDDGSWVWRLERVVEGDQVGYDFETFRAKPKLPPYIKLALLESIPVSFRFSELWKLITLKDASGRYFTNLDKALEYYQELKKESKEQV